MFKTGWSPFGGQTASLRSAVGNSKKTRERVSKSVKAARPQTDRPQGGTGKGDDMNINKYERGTNELLDKVYDEEDGDIYIVNGPIGRIPIMAGSESEALTIYKAKKNRNYSTLQVHSEESEKSSENS